MLLFHNRFGIGRFYTRKFYKKIKKENRFIVVKRFAEREVKADLAIWNIKTKFVPNDIEKGSINLDNTNKKMINFLLKKHIRH